MIFSIRDLSFELGSLLLEGWLALAARAVRALLMKAVSYFGTGRTNRKAPCCNKKHCNRVRRQQFACRFLHPDYTVGPGIAPGQHPQKVVADLENSLIVIARRLNIFLFLRHALATKAASLPPVGNHTPP